METTRDKALLASLMANKSGLPSDHALASRLHHAAAEAAESEEGSSYHKELMEYHASMSRGSR
jgi:hypothetical protein